MKDMSFKNLNWKYLDYNDNVMVIIITTAPNKVLDETLKDMDEWDKDLFKINIEKKGFMIEYIQLNTY